MGKNKTQRTKGNTKPSSSGRSAELLSSRGVNSFLGFGTLSVDLPGYSSPKSKPNEVEEVDISVDSDFRMVFRKATKRDTVTKIKALQEFSQLCQEKDEEAVKRALPFWPRIYCKLAIDQDRKVREAAHQAHKQVITKVKKNIAPFLKPLMGVWLVSMCDPYAPSSSAANQAFQIAFPPMKQAEALDFCKEDIFNYIEDILFQQTIDTVSDPKVSNQDERETQLLRLISSCFNSLHLFLNLQNDSLKDSNLELFGKLVNNQKFWKYAAHKDPEVKRGWYNTVQALCQFVPALVKEHAAKLCPLTLGCLNEDNPLVAATIWETSLHILVTLDDCWQFVNVEKEILPKLFAVVKLGGNGIASTIFHNLLPLLSQLPEASIQPESSFYEKFFGSLREGLKQETVRISSSELNAIMKAYMECLRFYLLRDRAKHSESDAIMTHLILHELLPLVKDAMYDSNFEAYSAVFIHLGELLRLMEVQAHESESEGAIVTRELLGLLFSKISHDLVIDDNCAPKLCRLFYYLHHAKENSLTAKLVRFAHSDQEKATKAQIQKPTRKSLRNSYLAKETYVFCEKVYAKFQLSPSLPLLKLFAQLVVCVPSAELFTLILNENSTSSPQNIAIKFTEAILLPMLKSSDAFESELEYVKCIMSMVVATLSCVPEHTQIETLNNLCEEESRIVLDRLVQQASELRNSDSRLANWLRGDYVGKVMVQLAEGLSNQLLVDGDQNSDTELAWRLLHICFTINREFDPFIASNYINTILSCFTKALSDIKPNNIANKPEMSFKIVKLVCDLAKNLFSQCQGCWYLPSAEALLLSLFQLSCKIQDKESTEPVSSILEETWFVGVKKLVELQDGEVKVEGFALEAVATIKQTLISKRWNYNEIENVRKLSEKFVQLCKAYSEGLKITDDENWVDSFHHFVANILNKILPDPKTWIEMENQYTALCKLPRTLCVSSLLDLPLIEISLGLLEEDLPLLLKFLAFLSEALNALFEIKIDYGDSAVDLGLKNISTLQISNHIPSLAMGVAIGRNIHIVPQVSKEHEIRKLFCKFDDILSRCIEKTEKSNILPMLETTLQRANEGSYPHAMTLAVLFQSSLTANANVQVWLADSINIDKLLSLIKEKGTNVPHVVYCMMPYVDIATVSDLVTMVTTMLLSDEQVSRDNDCWILGTLAVCFNAQNGDICTSPVIEESFEKVLRYFVHLWKINPNILNPNWSSKLPSSIQKITFVSQLASIFIAGVKNHPHIFDQDSWDAILCTLVGWIQRAHELWKEFSVEETTLIPSILAFKLLGEIQKILARCKNGQLQLELLPNLLTEWDELYLDNIYAQIIPLFMKLGESLKDSGAHIVLEKLMRAISQSLLHLPADLILKSSKEIIPSSFGEDSASITQFILEKLNPMLISSLRPLSLGTHCLQFNLMSKISEIVVGDDSSEEEEKSRSPPKPLVDTLSNAGQFVETLLSNFNIGDCCLVQPYTDSFTFTYVYMLSWMQLLKLFKSSTSEVRSEYAVHLQKSNLLEELLMNLFRLMPINPVIMNEGQKGNVVAKTLFTEPFEINFEAEASFTELQHVTCHVYLTTLRQLPALVRQWWHNRDKRVADIVNKYTTSYVSSYICQQEIKAVQDTETKFSNMHVKARPMAREVVAKYTMEEITIELVIKLPANHPLGPVAIETGQRISVSVTQWRNWMLQLTTFLTHQNGSILDGLSLWKRNVDKRFEGIEECMICFYVLHGATCQLPKLLCRTCKKRFHSACLFKWFSTSQNSSCPLCRNLF